MNQPPIGDGKPRGALEEALIRELGLDKSQPRHAAQKLQPVILPPPPAEAKPDAPVEIPEAPMVTGASADDDIDTGLSSEPPRSSGKTLAVIALLLAAAGGVGWLVIGRNSPRPEASVPTIQAPGPAELKSPAPPPAAAEAPVAPPTTAAPQADRSMGEVSTELTPPSTEGLSPARRVNATRIIVENDREVKR